MSVRELQATIHTYKDKELKELIKLLEPDADANGGSALRKVKACKAELKRRKKERAAGTYEDKTMAPAVPIRRRLMSSV